MSLDLFEEELKKIFEKHDVTVDSELYGDVWKECQEWYEGVVGVKDMVIEGVERRAEEAERKLEDCMRGSESKEVVEE